MLTHVYMFTHVYILNAIKHKLGPLDVFVTLTQTLTQTLTHILGARSLRCERVSAYICIDYFYTGEIHVQNKERVSVRIEIGVPMVGGCRNLKVFPDNLPVNVCCARARKTGSAMLMYVVAPSVLGQPFLRFYLMAEHKYAHSNKSCYIHMGVISWNTCCCVYTETHTQTNIYTHMSCVDA